MTSHIQNTPAHVCTCIHIPSVHRWGGGMSVGTHMYVWVKNCEPKICSPQNQQTTNYPIMEKYACTKNRTHSGDKTRWNDWALKLIQQALIIRMFQERRAKTERGRPPPATTAAIVAEVVASSMMKKSDSLTHPFALLYVEFKFY